MMVQVQCAAGDAVTKPANRKKLGLANGVRKRILVFRWRSFTETTKTTRRVGELVLATSLHPKQQRFHLHHGSRTGGIRTRTGWILSPLPLPLGYGPREVVEKRNCWNTPGRTRTCNQRIKSPLRYRLRYGGVKNRKRNERGKVMHRVEQRMHVLLVQESLSALRVGNSTYSLRCCQASTPRIASTCFSTVVSVS